LTVLSASNHPGWESCGNGVLNEQQAAKLAERHGTPLFLYDAAAMRCAVTSLRNALPPDAILFYAVKANPVPGVIGVFAGMGLGAEVASAAELDLALACGIPPEKIVFSGPAKTEAELEPAVMAGIYAVQAESWDELQLLQSICRSRELHARVALRVNLGPNARGERRSGWGGVSPFGMDDETLRHVVAHAHEVDRVRIIGVHHHLSSQSATAEQLVERFDAFAQVALQLRAQLDLEFVNFGGGFAAPFYADDRPLDLAPLRTYFLGLRQPEGRFGNWRPTIGVESGRYLTGPAGFYIARVISIKRSFGVRFAFLDGGVHHALGLSGAMRSLRRPVRAWRLGNPTAAPLEPTELAGPLCTPIDRLASAVDLPSDLRPGDLVVFANCGAYGKHASPLTFLGHDWPAEVLIDGPRASLVAPRMRCADLPGLRPGTHARVPI